MSERMPFSGIIRLEPGESLDTDGAAFQAENPRLIDRLLKIGAVTHRHDGHAALVDPTDEPVVAVLTSGGGLPAGQTLHVGYTYRDSDGGETVLSPAVTVSTDPPADPPADPPIAVVAYDSGGLLADVYYYAITLTDDAGGETPLSDVVTVVREAGYANGHVALSGLAADVAGSLTGWRLWRAVGGGQWGLLGTGAGDTFDDDGSAAVNSNVSPPDDTTNTTNAAQVLTVEVPDTLPADAVEFSIYVSAFGDFAAPSLVGTYPASDAGTTMPFATLSFLDYRPPAVSTCLPGATPINAAWQAAVATEADLPAAPGEGAARIVIDVGTLWIYTSGTWVEQGGAGAPGAWTTLPGRHASLTQDPRCVYRTEGTDLVRLAGRFDVGAAVSSSENMFATLPPEARPLHSAFFEIFADDGTGQQMFVGDDGVIVALTGLEAGKSYALDGVSWPTT